MITLSDDQQKAADEFMDFMVDPTERFMIIRGNAGSGKSTLTKNILQRVQNEIKLLSLLVGKSSTEDLDIFVTAPTNKAAKVIADIVNYEPQTIHSLLKLKVINNYSNGKTKLVKNSDYKLYENSLLVVDEASFIDKILLDAINESTPSCKVLFIGDPDQLAPPNEGNLPVFDLPVRTSYLTTNNRNSGPISDLSVKYKEAVSHGLFPKIKTHPGVIEHVDGPTFQSMIDKEFKNNHKENHAKILAWTNERVHEYNDYVRGILGMPTEPLVGEVFTTNKPIMLNKRYVKSTDSLCTVNFVGPTIDCLGIEGNMVGIGDDATYFLPRNQKDVNKLLKSYANNKEWTDYFYIKDSWLDLRPIHSCTVHKSQGSTYETVFVDLNDIGRNNGAVELARMLYVATSRASKKVVFYGDIHSKHYGNTL